MKCHYTYDKKVGKVLIPGCWGSVIHGISFCNCRDSIDTFEQFENKKYNEALSIKNKQIKELEQYNASLQRIIAKLYKNKK